MTVTEAPPSAPSGTTADAPREARGLVAVLGSGDHKTTGRLWIGAAALFLLLTVVVGVLLGAERVTVDELEVLGNDHVLQFFSLYRVALTFLVVIPLFIGLATAVVPLQVGAPTLAFPRAAAAALWTWLGGAVCMSCLPSQRWRRKRRTARRPLRRLRPSQQQRISRPQRGPLRASSRK
jgi:hypothetical protein